MYAIDLDRTEHWDEIGAAPLRRQILCRLAGFQRCTKHAGIGPDRQRIRSVLLGAAGQRDETAGAVLLWKRLGAPAGLAAAAKGLDPDLENLRGLGLEIVFRVADTTAGAHHLHIARFGAAFVTEAVPMGD